jgi:hypothetical protein
MTRYPKDYETRMQFSMVLSIAAHLGMWLACILEKHRVCTKCQGIDCFCDVEITGEA